MENDCFNFRVAVKQENDCFKRYAVYYMSFYGEGEILAFYKLGVFDYSCWIDGEKAILEQSAGVKDRNGKLIFEGDVVDVYIPIEDSHRKCVVEHVIDGGTAQWVCRYLDGGKRLHRTWGEPLEITAEYLDGDYCSIIGCIHGEGE